MFGKRELEELIELVRQNPGLYDQSLPRYKDVQWTSNLWKKLAEHFQVDGKWSFFYSSPPCAV
jgi:hypothetical protein